MLFFNLTDSTAQMIAGSSACVPFVHEDNENPAHSKLYKA